ncbi:MAG TPA: DNA translocase FtsK, partial [Ktedonobacteraceae bacterium]|nr:DNA translocase FtsK [Ktedonobacteraceae bacterium]
MAANGQRKEQKKRVGPSVDAGKTSRVSKAAGNIGSEAMRVEQRSGTTTTKQRSNNSRLSSRQSKSSNGKQSSKKGSSANRPAPAAPAPRPADSRIIAKMHNKWQSLEPHHQQRFFSTLLLLLALLLFGGLSFWSGIPLLGKIGSFFTLFFGWGAYPLALGLIAFAFAHLVEGLRKMRFIRWSLVIGLLVMLLLLLAESQLFAEKSGASGILGEWLARPLLGWPAPTPHVLVIGLLTLAAIFAFRIRPGHIISVTGFFKRLIADPNRSSTTSNAEEPSPYLGQRPQFSRYASSQAPGRTQQQPAYPDAQEDDESGEYGHVAIDFDADFAGDDDPLNDINLHKQQVGNVPRGNRAAPPLNRDEHKAAVNGAQQQALHFDEAASNQPANGLNHEMEPLAPNPLLSRQPKIVTRAANVAVESPWKLTDITLLNNPEEVKMHVLGDDTTSLAKIIQDTLRSFRVEAEVRVEDISIGPTVIRFGIRPTGKPAMKQDEKGRLVPIKDAAGNIVYEQRTRVSRIMALQNDLALVLEAKSIRMEAPVPGRPYVGVEIPNKNSRLVTLREILESKEYASAKAKSRLVLALGKDVAGAVRVGDLARMPHLLIAGATGAGKSVCLNAFIGSFLTQATPDDVRILMIDPKMVELNMYNGIPHLLAPVVTEVDNVVGLLKIAIAEMEKRYRLFSQLSVRNLDGYRKLRAERIARGDNTLKNLPAIVIIIDELADLMMAAPEEVETLICRLAQLARATGIHLIIATQRPSVDVITGLIKANIPTRISFMVSSAVDSRTIIDMGGAERLL